MPTIFMTTIEDSGSNEHTLCALVRDLQQTQPTISVSLQLITDSNTESDTPAHFAIQVDDEDLSQALQQIITEALNNEFPKNTHQILTKIPTDVDLTLVDSSLDQDSESDSEEESSGSSASASSSRKQRPRAASLISGSGSASSRSAHSLSLDSPLLATKAKTTTSEEEKQHTHPTTCTYSHK